MRVTLEPTTACSVDDDGPGIPPRDRERVFERFARGAAAGAPGSGLGLAIVAQQAELHGGEATHRGLTARWGAADPQTSQNRSTSLTFANETFPVGGVQ